MWNISQVILMRTDSNLCRKELTVHWSAPNSLIRSYLQPNTNSMWGDESEAVAPIIWLFQIVDAQKEEVLFPELLITVRSYGTRPLLFCVAFRFGTHHTHILHGNLYGTGVTILLRCHLSNTRWHVLINRTNLLKNGYAATLKHGTIKPCAYFMWNSAWDFPPKTGFLSWEHLECYRSPGLLLWLALNLCKCVSWLARLSNNLNCRDIGYNRNSYRLDT